MDIYKKKKIKNLLLALLFIIGVVLQINGHRREGYAGLITQVISLAILVLVLYLYNRRYR